jgi:filamentous hemagglutinin family protein
MNISKIYFLASIIFLFPVSAIAQITTDGSTSTTVDNNGNVSTIEAGNQAGNNLFHSFASFSVPNGNEAFFNNAADIDNILARVTGGNVSSIDGLIRANDANLFLINPAGVIFGSGASLDLGGAFYGSSADSIVFEDGEFSAINSDTPVLTINAPIGLSFRDEPAAVSVQGNMTVTGGQSLNLFGGNLNFNNTIINALGSNVSFAAISGAGTVPLNLDVSNISLADITVNNSQINVNGADGGSIEVNARNLSLSDNSLFNAGINSADSTPQTQAGNITINATENLSLDSGSIIRNNLSNLSSGNTGNILITAKNLSLANNSRLSTITEGQGNAGNITLNILENTTLNGTAEIKSEVSLGAVGNANNIQINSGSISLNDSSKLLADVIGSGDGGDIIITTTTLDLKEQSDFSTNLSGQGSAGNINIQASDSILLEGSTFQGRVLSGGEGNAGNIDIKTGSLELSNSISNQRSQILASTSGTGNAGNINIEAANIVSLDNDSSIQSQVASGGVGNAGNIFINTNDLSLTEGTKVNRTSLLANSVGEGNGGYITINASGNVTLDQFGLILTQGTAGTGDAGDVSITSDTLSLSNGSVIASNTGDAENPDISNIGDAGNIEINSRTANLSTFAGISTSSLNNATGQAGNVTFNVDSLTIEEGAGISAITENVSNGGTIEVNATDLNLITGGKITSLTNGEGNAGNINLNLERQLTIDGANAPIPSEELRAAEEILRELEPFTGLFATATDTAVGNGGNISIATPQTVSIFNGGQISVDSKGTGYGGNLAISAGDLDLDSGSQLIAETQEGQTAQQPSNINLQIERVLRLKGDSQISAQAFNNANGGNVNIDAEFVVAFTPETEGNDIIANARGGSGGRINITAQEIFGLQEGVSESGNATNDLDVSSEFGFDGNISINTPDINPKAGISDLPINAIAPRENVQQTCAANNANGISSLSLQGRGGIPAPPTNTLSSDNILFKGEFSQANQVDSNQNNSAPLATQSTDHSPIMTAQGAIYPARGVLVTEAGEIILTGSTNLDQRHPKSLNPASNCLTN